MPPGVDEHGKPALIVVDTLARNLGTGDESSAEDIGTYVGHLDVLRAELDCAVLTVHHCGHGSQERARGSSALKAAVDHEFRLELNGEQRLLTCTKAKDAEPPPPLALELKVVKLEGWALDGEDPPTSCVLMPTGTAGSAPTRQSKRLSGALAIAFDALHRAIKDYGVEPPAELKVELGQLRTPNKVVGEGPWRERCYKTGIAEGDQPAKQKAFSRARTKLRDLGYLDTWDGWFWSQLPCADPS